MQNASSFEMTLGLKEEYEGLTSEDWNLLKDQCLKTNAIHGLKQKDIIIMRLYFTFMGSEIAKEQDDSTFLRLCGMLFSECE